MMQALSELLAHFHTLKNKQFLYLPVHLASVDIRARYIRTGLGRFWFLLNPLFQAALFTLFYSAFRGEFDSNYPLYVLSGILLWEVVVSSVGVGTTAFIYAEGYLRNFNFPLIVYLLRVPIYVTFVYLNYCLILLFAILLFKPISFFYVLVTLIIIIPYVFLISFSLTLVYSYLGLLWRDISSVMSHILQAVWFISPVFIWKDFFSENFSALLYYNPIYYLLNIVRKPLFDHEVPSIIDITIPLIIVILFLIVGVFLHKKYRKNIALRL